MKIRSPWQGSCFIPLILAVSLLCGAGVPVARGDDSSRAAKVAELMRLTGLAQMMAQSRAMGQAAAQKTVQSMAEQALAKFPAIPPEKRARIEDAAKQFLRDVDSSFDQDDAVRAWGRFYSENLTEAELDAILAYYRSPVGQKDVSASRAALPQFQQYIVEKRTAVMNTAVANYTTALRSIVDSPAADAGKANTVAPSAAKANAATPDTTTPNGAIPGAVNPSAVVSNAAAANAAIPGAVMSNAGTPGAATPSGTPVRPWDTSPSAPNGRLIPDSPASERCEVASPTAPGVHAVPPSGRSVVCVCTDEKGALTRDAVIAESSGDSRVDSGALKMARSDSGRYVPPTLDGQPQRACFRFAIDFRQHQ
jgi:hypothetical protein